VPRTLRPLNGRPARTDFASFVDGLPAPSKLLGLTHVTSSYVLRDIIDTGSIAAQVQCKVMGEAVTYAFYGRAAFRGSSEFQPTTLSCLFPSVLILDPNKVPPPKYVFGFDSGAFHDGLMDSFLHPYMPLFDFMLAPTPVSAARLVSAVFDTNDDYFANRASNSFTVPTSNFEADCYRQIVNGAGHGATPLDDRASTPELLFVDPLDLRSCVSAAVLPDTLAADHNIGERLKRLGIRVYDYPWTSCSRPVENHFAVRQLVQAAYKDLAWL
jgi:hypothetical protein